MDKLRTDKYLWAIRIFKTRTQAADACEQGKVKCNSLPVKPSHPVSPGEEYAIKTPARKWLIRVTGLLDHRVQYREAVNFYADVTPEEELHDNPHKQQASFYTGKRQSKTGRPTKKQRRDRDDFMNSSR